MKKYRIKKGDQVIVISGTQKGKKGEVLRVVRDSDRVVVAGINLVKRHTRASQTSSGGIVSKEAPMHISNVAHLDPQSGKATKVTYKVVDGRKLRMAKKSNEIIDK